jgi:hypothetical protein
LLNSLKNSMQENSNKEDFDQKHFFDFEKKFDLFDKKVGKLYYWDLIRFELFYHLLWNYGSNVNSEKKGVSGLVQIIKELKTFFIFLFFKKCNFLLFTASRNKIDKKKVFDQNLGDVTNNLTGENYYAFESFERDEEKWFYSNTLFNPINIFRRVLRGFYKKNDYSDILAIIGSEYENSIFSNNDINRIVIDFKIDFLFYKIVLKIKKPLIIFITQNGVQKGLFFAAKKCNVPIVEVQHGIIDEGHLAYNYNTDIQYKEDQIYLPTYFFTFSDFWIKKLYFPVKEILSIGNSFFFNSQKNQIIEAQNEGLLIASSDIFGENLRKITVDFANKNPQTPVCFKLHPNQFSEKQYYIDQFSAFQNVKVFSNEKSIYELLEISRAILIIQSTALYEAYHLKKTCIIYKKQTYRRHSHVFGLPNIYLVDNEDELFEAYNRNFVDDNLYKNLFFTDFDTTKFVQFVDKLRVT